MKEVAVLMGLMCKYSCENCDFVVFDESRYDFITPKAGTILDNMADTVSAVCIQ
jgi:telomerase protein component 1